MNRNDARQPAGAEPADGTRPVLETSQGEDVGAQPPCWEGYSPDTLAALDGLPPGAL